MCACVRACARTCVCTFSVCVCTYVRMYVSFVCSYTHTESESSYLHMYALSHVLLHASLPPCCQIPHVQAPNFNVRMENVYR